MGAGRNQKGGKWKSKRQREREREIKSCSLPAD